MQNKLFVGGLAWGTDSAGLEKAFASFGRIEEARVITDRETGRSRGFGFVTFANEDDAKKALSLDGSTLDDRSIKVNLAEDKPRRDGGGFGGGGGGGGNGGARRW
jgi:RNA recognition motif-containing protein